MLNNSKKDMDMMKRMFHPKKITLIDELDQKSKQYDYEIGTLKTAVENSATRMQIHELKESLMCYATKQSVNDLEKDYSGFVTKE